MMNPTVWKWPSAVTAVAAVAALAAFGLLCLQPTSRGDEVKPPPHQSYQVIKTLKVGGEGGWDYATLDGEGRTLYLTRTTHTIALDVASGKTLADFAPTKRAHGVALVPEAGRGFVTDGGAGAVSVFDLKTHAVLGTVAAADDADGVIYDPASRRVLVSCGDAHVLVPIDPRLDPKSGKADPAVELGGKPEFLAADGKGRAYVNLVDKNVIAVIDTSDPKAMKVVSKWPTAPGTAPTALALDAEGGRLYVGCRSQKLVVMSTKDGTVLADLPIGRGVDAAPFRDGTAFASCGDGTLAVVRETAPGKFDVVQTVRTATGAKTLAVDAKTGLIYLPTADMEAAGGAGGAGGAGPGGGRPKPLPGTFKVLVVGPAGGGPPGRLGVVN
jgi:DNA-binding beta-propeller fold protein YncE